MKHSPWGLMFRCCCRKKIKINLQPRLFTTSRNNSSTSTRMNSNTEAGIRAIACTLCSLPLDINMINLCPNCRGGYCVTCMNNPYPSSNSVCPSCIIVMGNCSKVELMQLKVRYLLKYMETNHIPSDKCKEKEDLVNMILVKHGASQPRIFGTYNEPMDTSYDSSIRVNPCDEAVDLSIRVRPIADNFEAGEYGASEENYGSIRVRPSAENMEDPESSEEESELASLHSEPDTPIIDETHSSGENVFHCDSNNTNPSASDLTNLSQSDNNPECIDLTGDDQKYSSSIFSNLKRPASLTDLQSATDAEKLNPRQCKEILAKHRVTYKGICEKAELISKVRQLYNDEKSKKLGDFNLSDEHLCCICMENPKDCVMLECGHMCSCTDCGKQVNECPICREYVVRIVRVFKV